VFIDANEKGAYDNGEEYGITSSNGSFFLSDIPPGLIRIDVEIANEGTEDASWELTTPALGYRQVDLGPGGVVSGQNFGLDNRADKDWGDLPDSYQTLASSNGPSHVIIPGFQLGSGIDGEVNGIPTDTANGDDLVGNDDDGIVILSNGGNLQVGPNVLQITVQGVGGLLNGWMDFNGDGHFDAGEQVFKNLDINQGTVQRTVNVPEGSVTGAIAARFRWGDPNLSWFGPAGIGEVEDYLFPSSVVAVLPLAGDYNGDLTVDELDRSLWASTFGSTTDLRADGNDNGIVDSADYLVWRKNRGASAASSSTAATASISDVTSDATDPPASSQQQFQVVVLSGGLAGVVDTSIDDSVSPTLVESTSAAAVNTDVPVGLSASIDVVATPAAARPAYRPVSGTVSSESSSFDSNLVLVDHALADFNTGSDDSDDGSLVGYLRDADNIDDVSDLALAAVIEDDSSWWSGI
jgi:hypothetical protein